MNIEQLRHTLKVKWLCYYQQNRSWLVKLQVWGTENGKRCPKSSFILATVSSLEPELTELLPFLVALNNNPDCIASALGLNFDPDEELKLMSDEQLQAIAEIVPSVQTNGNSDRLPDDMATVAHPETSSDNLHEQMLTYDENEVDATNVTGVNHLYPSAEKSSSSAAKPHYAGAILSILTLISSIAFIFANITG